MATPRTGMPAAFPAEAGGGVDVDADAFFEQQLGRFELAVDLCGADRRDLRQVRCVGAGVDVDAGWSTIWAERLAAARSSEAAANLRPALGAAGQR